MKSILCAALACLFFMGLPAAADSTPPASFETADPQRMMSAGFALMNFSDEEKQQFGSIMQAFTAKVKNQILRENRRNEPDLPRRINRRLHHLFENLDEQVKAFVSAERQAGYQLFKTGLERHYAPPKADDPEKVEMLKRQAFRQATRRQ